MCFSNISLKFFWNFSFGILLIFLLNCFESIFATEKNSLVRIVFSAFRNIKRNANVQKRLSVTTSFFHEETGLNQSRWWDCRKLATNIVLGELELATEKIQQFGIGFGIGFDPTTGEVDLGHWTEGQNKHPGYVCPKFVNESGEEFPVKELMPVHLNDKQAKKTIWCPSALLFLNEVYSAAHGTRYSIQYPPKV